MEGGRENEEIPPLSPSPVLGGAQVTTPTATPPPRALVHLVPPVPRSGLAPRLYKAPTEEAGLRRQGVCSVGSDSRNNVVWHPSSGRLSAESAVIGSLLG